MKSNFLRMCLAGLVAAGGMIPAGVLAGELRGRVILPPGAAAPPQQASMAPYLGMGGGAETEPRAATPRDAVVYLTGMEGSEAHMPEIRPTLAQINYQFEPRVVGVPVGSTVDFPNGDAVFHNVFSYSKTKKFDLGYYGKGKSKAVTFDRPGLVKVFCDIHSSMSAFVLVVDSPFVVQPDRNGTYSIPEVPDGEWTLHVWHPERGSHKQTVVISGLTETDIHL